MSSLFQSNNDLPKGTIGALVRNIRAELNNRGPIIDSAQMRSVVALESLDDHTRAEFTRNADSLKSAISAIADAHCKDLGGKTVIKHVNGVATEQLVFDNAPSHAQKMAAVVGGMLTAATGDYLSRELQQRPPLSSNDRFIPATGGEIMERRVYGENRTPALEAFDERENKETALHTIAYNMQAATQDEFGEALFPTIVVTPEQYGLTISMRLVMVMDDLRRNTSGDAIRNFERKNIIRAAIDPEILRNDTTKIIPVVRDEAEANFVDPALVAPTNIVHEGVSVTTAPLAIGAQFDLLGISQTDALLATGTLDTTDAIDPNIVLDALYMSVSGTSGGNPLTEVIKLGNLKQVLGTTFTAAPQGNYKQQMLNFVTDSLTINGSTKLANGASSVLLATPIAAGYQVKLAVTVSGNVNLQTAETSIIAGKLKVAEIRDASNNTIDIKTGVGATYAALFNSAVIFGYDLDARRVNTNRRERGQLLDITFQNVIYGVPLLSPITAPRPPAGPQQDEANYLAGLITTTRVRTSNGAVQALIDAEQTLAAYVASNLGDQQEVKPEVLGMGGYLVQAFYEKRTYVAPSVVDSIKSHERALDIQTSLVNIIRDMAYRAYRESGYKAAANAMHGGIAPMPTVIIATDTVIAGYLQVVGDFRTIGAEFNVKVVSTTNKLMKNKILFTFGEFGEGRENTPNVLHFGNMAWKPELTLVLPTVRNGSNAREISVSPSFRHIVHLPILCSIDVSGITDVVVGKVSVNMHTVA